MGVGFAFQGANIYAQMFAQGITGGIMEGINGGDLGNAFLSAGLTTAFMPQVGYIQNDYARTRAVYLRAQRPIRPSARPLSPSHGI